ncbi:YggT family protein, partial [Campylobacter concisus]
MILSTLFSAIANILHLIITVYTWIVIAAALISWVKPDPSSPVVQLLYRLT